MEHIKSSFYFQNKEETWRVDYVYDQSQWRCLKALVYLNDDLYWDFESIPNTRTENPTKSQAKEIITAAKKEYKKLYALRDKRDENLTKLIG